MLRLTTKQLADHLDVDYVDARGLVSILVKKGISVKAGRMDQPQGKRGKPSDIFDIPETIEIHL